MKKNQNCNATVKNESLFCGNYGKKLSQVANCANKRKTGWWVPTVFGLLIVAFVGSGCQSPSNKVGSAEAIALIEQRVNKMLNDGLYGEYIENDTDPMHLRYFSKSFKALCDKVDENLEEGEIGYFDHDIWTQSQDACPSRFQVTKINMLSDTIAVAEVQYHYNEYDEVLGDYPSKQIRLNLIYEDDNWYIDDFSVKHNKEKDFFSEREGMEVTIIDNE